MLIISAAELAQLVPMRSAIACLRARYPAQAALDMVAPERTFIRCEARAAVFGSMPIYSADDDKYVVKVASFHLHNKAKDLPSIQGLVIVQNGSDGRIEAVIDASSLTALRTAATCGVVADRLLPASIDSIAVIGTGAQALAQLEAMLSVRTAATVRVYSRNPANVARFIRASAPLISSGCRIEAADSVAQAVGTADVVCTATTCASPLFAAGDVRPGTHISAVGKHTTETREFPPALLDDALLVVEERGAAIREAGSYHQGATDIGELLAADFPLPVGRTTIFSSVGTAFQDLCIALLAAQRRAHGSAATAQQRFLI